MSGIALKELIVAMGNSLSPKDGMEFYNMAIAKYTILAIKQVTVYRTLIQSCIFITIINKVIAIFSLDI